MEEESDRSTTGVNTIRVSTIVPHARNHKTAWIIKFHHACVSICTELIFFLGKQELKKNEKKRFVFRSSNPILMDNFDHWCRRLSADVVEPFLSALPGEKGDLLRQWTDHLETYIRQGHIISSHPPPETAAPPPETAPPPPETAAPKRRTAYQRFFSEVFPTIRASQADGDDQSFRTISQKIGHMWKTLPDTERERYRIQTDVPMPTESTPKKSSESDANPNQSHTVQNLTVRALGDLCSQRGLPRKGTKSILIDRILRWEQSQTSPQPIPPSPPTAHFGAMPLPSTRDEEDAFAILRESSLDRVATPTTPEGNRTGRDRIDFSRVLIVPEFPFDPHASSKNSGGIRLVTTILETTKEDEENHLKPDGEEGDPENMVFASVVGIDDGPSEESRCGGRDNAELAEDSCSDDEAGTGSSGDDHEFDLHVMDEEGGEEEVGAGYDSEDA